MRFLLVRPPKAGIVLYGWSKSYGKITLSPKFFGESVFSYYSFFVRLNPSLPRSTAMRLIGSGYRVEQVNDLVKLIFQYFQFFKRHIF